MSEKMNREEWDTFFEAFVKFADSLANKDRHERGGTTLGERLESGSAGEAWLAVLRDPAQIRKEIALRLAIWLGDRSDIGLSEEGNLNRDWPVGIAKLGKANPYGSPHPDPHETATRSARHSSMTEEKSSKIIAELRELEKLVSDIASEFEKRLQEESEIRRIQ
jgi:hypothetical protein